MAEYKLSYTASDINVKLGQIENKLPKSPADWEAWTADEQAAARERMNAADADTVDALWKLNEGISYDYVTDSAEAYEKTVPTGAKSGAVKMFGGKSLVWNQIRKNYTNTVNQYGLTFTPNGDETWTVNGTATETGAIHGVTNSINVVTGHKYFLKVNNEWVNAGGTIYANIIKSATYTNNIIEATESKNATLAPRILAETTFDNIKLFIICVDLTLLFGIGNEPTSTDDERIKWIEQYAEAHPEYNAGEIVSADVENIKYNSDVIGTIPSSVRSLTGYGWSAGTAKNTIEQTDDGRWIYTQNVGSVDLGSLTWKYETALSRFYSINFPIGGTVEDYHYKNTLTKKYVRTNNETDKTHFIFTEKTLYVYDSDYTDATTFTEAVNGEILYYELAEPIITDITDMMTDFPKAFTVEAGGSITFENEAKLPVPNSIEYLRSLKEVNA